MLDFFILQQKNITKIKENYIPLTELKEQCEIYSMNKKNLNSFAQIMLEEDSLNNQNCKIIPKIIPDSEFRPLFSINNLSFQSSIDEKIFTLFTSELSSDWKDLMICKSDENFVVRSGFYSSEYDIYESILLGFNGIILYCKGFDKFKIQYFTEIGRDFHFSIFFLILSKQELLTVLETDAPYFPIFGFNPHSFSLDFSLLVNLINLIPKTAEPIAYVGKVSNDKIKFLQDIGYKYIIRS
ncbi:hypothetical protein [Fluviispira sanaruensis]|uniref:Uncharacterized protein n=1 Tax=Fluviispira sanaruensis TaxID=2493639 RepID=A0A4P2VKT3_FLUSA|nr:hypothetical protein [Fluviispira sanaruensis]BBH52320.1 hypothetical protein JCM31447_07610 [Fluviispira sanaruensis]